MLLLCGLLPQAEAFLTATRDPGTDREPVSTECRAGGQGHAGPLLPGRTPKPQMALGVTGASPPRGDGGLGPSAHPSATSAANTRETRLPCWWPGQHRVGLGAPRTPFAGTEHSPPWGCPSVSPPAALLASAGPPLKSASLALTRETPPDAAVFRILVFATSFGHELCQGPREYPRLPARAYPCLQHPKPRRTREASRARWKTA